MKEKTIGQRASSEYLRLLQIPRTSMERVHNQKLMALLRDIIAEASGASEQEVQESFEKVAADIEAAYPLPGFDLNTLRAAARLTR